jgi:hypothetical protein
VSNLGPLLFHLFINDIIIIIIIIIIIQRTQQKNSNYRVLLKFNDIKRIEKYLYSLNALN